MFEEEGPIPEVGAQVTIIANGEQFAFAEVENGVYLSTTQFAAQPNVDYQLKITTSNNRTYASKPTQLTAVTQIDNLYAERIINDLGEDGVAIYVDSFDPTSNARFYRYEYEETYKIQAPFYRENKLIVTGNVFPDCSVEVVPREEDVRVCYTTKPSKNIVLTSTQSLQQDKVERFKVRFLRKDNFIISSSERAFWFVFKALFIAAFVIIISPTFSCH